MILIHSTYYDQSTTEVIRWLKYYNANFLRVNDDMLINNISISNEKIIIELNDGIFINTDNISSFWYRRGDVVLDFNAKYTRIKTFDEELYRYNYQTNKRLLDFIVFFFKNKLFSINDYFSSNNLNKIITLEKAKDVGLRIPEYIITTKKDEAKLFIDNHKNIIIKAIDNPFTLKMDNQWISTYTEAIDDKFIENLPSKFMPTFFQMEIKKKSEIRTFFFSGKCYSMAIFSQKNNQTKTDYRKYDDDCPNRNVPFKLPDTIEKNIASLMEKLGLISGSIDFIYGIDNNFYFLEVNPIGQFGNVSYNCNYCLEQKIALKLIENDTQRFY